MTTPKDQGNAAPVARGTPDPMKSYSVPMTGATLMQPPLKCVGGPLDGQTIQGTPQNDAWGGYYQPSTGGLIWVDNRETK